jgi:hypothetical protein
MKLLIYVPLLTPRIKYIFNFIFTDVLKTQIGFSSNLAEFKQSGLAKISYAEHAVGNELFFKNSELLLSHSIIYPTIKTTVFGDTIVPFAVSGGALPFDVFAASFYFVTRYEEYLPQQNGQHSFNAEHSLQNKLKLLQIPIIDAWALIIKNLLLKQFPNLLFFKKQFIFKSLICMAPDSPKSGRLIHLADIMLKKIRSKFGKIHEIDSSQLLIQRFVEEAHSPFGQEPTFFHNSICNIDQACDGDIELPDSYLKSIRVGANNDYRMGYSHTPGFRAGTCTPFYWYDLQLEKTTHLLIHPVAINDAGLRLDKPINVLTTIQQWQNLVDTVKMLEGSFYMLWHKDNLAEGERGKNGRKLYKEMLMNFLTLTQDVRAK